MQKEIELLKECNDVLYWIYSKATPANQFPFVLEEEISRFWQINNMTNAKEVVLNRLKIEGVVNTFEGTAAKLNNRGLSFCFKEHSLIQEFKDAQVKEKGAIDAAALSTFTLKDYPSTKWKAVWGFWLGIASLIISIASAVIAYLQLHKK